MSQLRERLEVARKVGRLIATAEGRDLMRQVGDCTSIVPAGWEESIRDVFERVRMGTPPAVIASLYKGHLELMSVRPGNADDAQDTELAHEDCTIGMLFFATAQSDEDGVSFRIGQWDTAHAEPVAPDRQLELPTAH